MGQCEAGDAPTRRAGQADPPRILAGVRQHGLDDRRGAGVAIVAGIIASSIVLVGFGLDSVIEFFSAAVVVWQLRGGGEERETRAVRLIGISFFVLAAYLAAESIHDLVTQSRPGESTAGIAVTAAALLIMPSLALAKYRTGTALGNRTLTADAAESAFCAFTSGGRAARRRAQRLARLVVGRPCGSPGHRRACRQGRPRSLER